MYVEILWWPAPSYLLNACKISVACIYLLAKECKRHMRCCRGLVESVGFCVFANCSLAANDKITRGDPWGHQVSVCFRNPEQIRTAKARQRCNFWCLWSAFHFFPSLYILFPSFLVPGTALHLADVPSCSLRLFLPFLKVAAGSWLFVNTETKVGAVGRQREAPLYKITRGDPWGYQVPVCLTSPEQIRTAKARQRCNFWCSWSAFHFLSFPLYPVPFLSCSWDGPEPCWCVFLLFASLSALPEDCCWFLAVRKHRDEGWGCGQAAGSASL